MVRAETGYWRGERALLAVIFAVLGQLALSQTFDGWRERWVAPRADTLRIDTLSIVPESLELRVDSAAAPASPRRTRRANPRKVCRASATARRSPRARRACCTTTCSTR